MRRGERAPAHDDSVVALLQSQPRRPSLDGRGERSQPDRITSTGRSRVAFQLRRQRVTLIQDRPAAVLSPGPKPVDALENGFHRARPLGWQAPAARELIDIRERHDGTGRPDDFCLLLRIQLLGPDKGCGVDFILRQKHSHRVAADLIADAP